MSRLLQVCRTLTLLVLVAGPTLVYGGAASKDAGALPVSPTMFIRGTFNAWGAQPMVLDAGVWKSNVTFGANGAFKFDQKGDWTVNWGDNPPRDGIVDGHGANIGIDAAGEYEVVFDEDNKKYTVIPVGGQKPCGTDNLYFRGTPNGWAATPMVCQDKRWKTTVTFGANGSFKVDVFGDWSRNYGDNSPRDGKLDGHGANIPVVDAGEYDLEVDMFALTYTLTPKGQQGCGAAQMFFRGTPNAWAATPMVCNAQGLFETTQPFAANGSFKFDVKGDWTENYGDNSPRDGAVERNGQNILIEQAGSYVIRFNYRTKTYTVTGGTPGCGTPTMFIRGTFNTWKNDKPMQCVGGKWTATAVPFAANGAFKFDVKGDWTENYGDNAPRDGKVERNGGNIVVSVADDYDVSFDYNAKTYVVTPTP